MNLYLKKILASQINYWLSIGLLSIITLLLIFYPIYRISFSGIFINYNEAWNAYHLTRVNSGELLYNLQQQWTPVNYPPFSFYIVSGFSKLIHNPILAGRYLSLLSLLLIITMVVFIVNILIKNLHYAVLSGIFCLSLFTTMAQVYIGMNDPQLLGHLPIILALLIYLRPIKIKYHLLIVAALMAVGIFIKHNLIALPLAITIELFLISRPDFFKWLIYLGLITSGFILISINISGSNFIHEVMLTGSRVYSIPQIVNSVDLLLTKLFIPFILAIIGITYAARHLQLRITALYLVISISTGIYFSGGLGTNINIYFDTFISLSILLGVILSYLDSKSKLAKIFPLVISLSMIMSTRIMIIDSIHQIIHLPDLAKEEQMNRVDASFLAQQDGSVLCIHNSIFICYLSGKSFEYDSFNGGQMIATGKNNKNSFLEKINTGYFRTILLDNDYLNLGLNENNLNIEKSPIQKIHIMVVKYITDGLEKKFGKHSSVQFKSLDFLRINILQAINEHYIISHKSINGTFYTYKK